MLISRLDSIRDSDDIEANKILGSSILTPIADTDTMTNAQKLDFKEILSSLVYGDVANIPEEERNEVIATA
jgi:hypothetical protein